MIWKYADCPGWQNNSHSGPNFDNSVFCKIDELWFKSLCANSLVDYLKIEIYEWTSNFWTDVLIGVSASELEESLHIYIFHCKGYM